MPSQLSDEKKNRLFEKLSDGEKPADIAEDLEIAEKTVYNYKDEWEEREDIRNRVSQSRGVTKDKVVNKAEEIPGLGNQTSTALEKALGLNDSVLENPDELYKLVNQVSDLDHYWIDMLVRSVFPHLDGQDSGGGPQQGRQPQYGGSQQRGGSQGASPGYPSPQSQHPQQGQRPPGGGRQPPAGYQQGHAQQPPRQPAQQSQESDQRVDELEEKIDQLGAMVSEVVENDQSSGQMAVIETDDGKTMRVPADDPRVQDALGSSPMDQFMQFFQMASEMGMVGDDSSGDDEDFLTQVKKMREAGIINDNDDEVMEMVSEQISQGMEAMNQSQQQIMGNMQQTLQQIAEVANEDGDDELTREEVKELLAEKQEKQEIEELKDRLDQQREEFRRGLKEAATASGDTDPETLKTQKGYQLREKQIDTMSDAVKDVPEVAGETVQNSLLPILQLMKPDDGSLADAFYQHPDARQRPINYDPSADNQPAQPPRGSRGAERPNSAASGRPAPPRETETAGTGGTSPDPENANDPANDPEKKPYGAEVADKILDDGDGDSEEVEA